MALSYRVELLASPLSSFFEYFTLDDDSLGLLDGDAPLADDLIVVDVTSAVRSFSVRRGRMRDIDEFGPGLCQVEFNNDDRAFDPVNADSPYYGNIEPMRAVIVTAVLDSVDYPLFYGYAQQWLVDYSEPNLPIASVTCADALAILANQDIDEIASSFSGDLSGARVTRVLNRSEVAFPDDMRSIDTGDTTFGATTLGVNAYRYLQLCAQSEGGALYISTAGVLVFEQRSSAPGATACTFSDDEDPTHVEYAFVDQDMSVDLLYNRVLTSGTSAATQTAEDASSMAAYQVRTLNRTGQLALNNSDMLGQANYLLGRFKAPEMRLRQVVVNVHALAAARQAEVLGLELTDRVTVERTPPGGGSPANISQVALVDGLDWSVQADGSTVATVTLATGDKLVGFVLDDDDFGVLDGDALLIY